VAKQVWPASLPDCPQSWQETEIDVLIRTEMDVGIEKTRRRYTGKRMAVQVSWTITANLYHVFIDFFETTLKQGIDTFDYDHPITKVATEYRFTEPPSISFLGDRAVQISCDWEAV